MARRTGSSSSMICMARTFGAPLSVPAGKQAANASSALEILAQRAFQRRHQVHHVGVALHIHQVLHFNRSIFAHPAQIVAAKIDQHDVLGAFLFVVAHLLFEAQVFGLVAPARMRACDGPIFQLAASHTHQHFGRRAEDLRLSHPQEIKIWRGIYLAQSAR